MHRTERAPADFTVDDAYAFANRLRGDPNGMSRDRDTPVRDGAVAQWPVKVYAGGNRVRLPELRPWWVQPREGVQPDRMSRLSELLMYSAGITRAIWRPGGTAISSPQKPGMVWPSMHLGHRRTVPSGGAMYPTEVYLVDLVGEGKGVFHYDPARHDLLNLEHPATSGALRAALLLGSEEPIHPLWMVLTHRFRKNTFKYGNFAYRLGGADLGVIGGRASALGHRLFGSVSTKVNFDDEALNQLCGNDSREESAYLAVGFASPVLEANPKEDPSAPSPGGNPPPVIERGPAVALSRTFFAMHRCASRVTSSPAELHSNTEDRISDPLPVDFIARGAQVDEDIQLARSDFGRQPGARAFTLRRSAGAYFVDAMVDVEVLETVLFRTMEAIEFLRCTSADGHPPRLQLVCAVDRVRSIPAGWYLYQFELHRLVPIEGPGPVPPSVGLQEALHAKTVDLQRSAFSIHIAGELDFRTHPQRARAYRCQQIFVGAAIDTIVRWCTECGIGNHPIHGFDAARIDKFYGLDHGPFGVLAQVAVGHTRPNGTLECSISS